MSKGENFIADKRNTNCRHIADNTHRNILSCKRWPYGLVFPSCSSVAYILGNRNLFIRWIIWEKGYIPEQGIFWYRFDNAEFHPVLLPTGHPIVYQ